MAGSGTLTSSTSPWRSVRAAGCALTVSAAGSERTSEGDTMSDPTTALDELAATIGRRFGRQIHPEVQELILERMDAPGEHTLHLEWADAGALRVVLDGIEVATL